MKNEKLLDLYRDYGVFSSFGTMQKEGAVPALEEVGYKVADKTITVIYEDDQLDNEQAVTKAKKAC